MSTALDELERLREMRAEGRKHLLHVLRAPYNRMSAWAITNACIHLDHPSRHDDRPDRCICGKQDGWLQDPAL